jgi:ATP-dependent RNA helicase DDX21
LSYALPLLERLHLSMNRTGRKIPQMLVMTPTRELARQVTDVMATLTDNLSVVTVYGGAPIAQQEMRLSSGVDVVVGTPGRIADFLERGTLDLTQLQHVVLDEVDRMLDMGFADSVDDILRHRYTPGNTDKNPQTLLFSATIPSWVQKTARKYLRDDITKLDLVGRGTVRTATSVEHLAIPCTQRDRTVTIANTLQAYSGSHGRAIIFCETKRDADQLAASQLIRVETHALHGDIAQSKREMVLKGFREGRYRCLIATDVAARGLDIPEVDLILQCTPPKAVDSYIHRSGRPGRAGRPGLSVLLYRPGDMYDLNNVERVAGIKFKRIRAPSADVLTASAVEDAVKSMELVPKSVIDRFTKQAEEISNRLGAVPSLAAAIAVLTGNHQQTSLLTASPCFTTFLLKSPTNVDRLGKAWQTLERLVPLEIKDRARGMRLCADHSGCVFDLPSECESELMEIEGLTKPAELPELEEPQYTERPGGGEGYRAKEWGGHRPGNDWGNRGGERRESWGGNKPRRDSWDGNKPRSWQHSSSPSWQHSASRETFRQSGRYEDRGSQRGGDRKREFRGLVDEDAD